MRTEDEYRCAEDEYRCAEDEYEEAPAYRPTGFRPRGYEKSHVRICAERGFVFPGTGAALRATPVRRLSSVVKRWLAAIDPETANQPALCSDPGGRPVEVSRKTATNDRAPFVDHPCIPSQPRVGCVPP